MQGVAGGLELKIALLWVLVQGFNVSYHNEETILFTIDPYYGNLTSIPNKNPVLGSRCCLDPCAKVQVQVQTHEGSETRRRNTIKRRQRLQSKLCCEW